MIEIHTLELKHGFHHILGPGKYIIGRGKKCNFVIEDDSVSRQHVLLEVTETEGNFITDLDSLNRSYVNGKPVEGKTLLHSGDIVTLGEVKCKFQIVDMASAKADVIISDMATTIPGDGVVPIEDARRLASVSDIFNAATVEALSHLGSLLVESGAPESLFEKGLDFLTRSLGTQRAFILNPLGDRRNFEIKASYIQDPGALHKLVVSRTIIDEVLCNRAVVLVPDVTLDERFDRAESLRIAGVRSVLAMPLLDQDKITAILYTDTGQQNVLTSEHQRIFTVFGDMIAAKMSNWKLIKENEEKALVEKELEITRKKQDEIEKAYQQLKEAQERLIQTEKMASLGRLVAGVTHEMNTPMGALAGSIGVLDRAVKQIMKKGTKEAASADEKIRKTIIAIDSSMNTAEQCLERLSSIVNALGNFARLDQPEFEAVDLNLCLDETLVLLNSECADRITIVRKYGKLPPVECATRDINQVFMNVLRNAVEAIEGKGIITITTKYKHRTAIIIVEDTGKGIPPEELQKLFDPHFTTKGERYRLGLGLPTSFRIIEAHSGNINAESTVGKGSKFTVNLPVKGT